MKKRPINRQLLFAKYSIDESHSVWENEIDNWASVEIYRLMHDGKLPPPDDDSVIWVANFLDKPREDMEWWIKNVMNNPKWGILFLTAKRMIHKFADELIKEINEQA